MKRIPIIRKIAVYAFYILFFTTFQVTFGNTLSYLGIFPDLMLVFVVLSSYMFGFYDGIIVGAVTGIIRDYFCAPTITGVNGTVTQALGIGLFLMVAAASAGSSFFTVRIKRNFLLAISAVGIVTFLYKVIGHLVVYLLSNIFYGTSYNPGFKRIILISVLAQGLLNVLSAVPIYLALRFLGPYPKGVNPSLKDVRTEGDVLWLTK